MHQSLYLIFLLIGVVLTARVADRTRMRSRNCPKSKPQKCTISPCYYSKCPCMYKAVCRDEVCGVCRSRWYLGRTDVTRRCRTCSRQRHSFLRIRYQKPSYYKNSI